MHQGADEGSRFERPAHEDPPGDIASNRDPVADWAEPTPLALPGKGGYRNFVNAPPTRDGADQDLGLEHEAAPMNSDLLEELDRIRPEARLRIADSQPTRPVHEKPRDANRVQPVGRENARLVEAPSDHDRPRHLPYRVQHPAEIRRPMLPVAVERHDDRDAAGARRGDAGADRLALAEAAQVAAHVGAGEPSDLRAPVAGAIVDDQHGRVRSRRGHDLADGVRFVEDGNDDERVHASARPSGHRGGS